MLDIIMLFANTLYVGTVLIGNIVLFPDQAYHLHKRPDERDIVQEVSFHAQWYKKDSECKFTGLLVPWVRDWPETINAGREDERVLPPEPDTTAGHAVILDKKICPNKPVEPVFLIDTLNRNFGIMAVSADLHFGDPDAMRLDQQPKWLTQVLQRIQRAADQNPDANDFVETIAVLQKNRAERARRTAAVSATPSATAQAATVPADASVSLAASVAVVAASEPADANAATQASTTAKAAN